MKKYMIRDLKFMTVKEKNNNYYYLGIYNSDVSRVYIPTLDNSYSYSEISFGTDLTSEYVETVPGFGKKVKYEADDFGYVESCGLSSLSEGEIKKVERYRNTPAETQAPPADVDPIFFRRRGR